MIEFKYHIITHLHYSTFMHAIALVNKQVSEWKVTFFAYVLQFVFTVVLYLHYQNIYQLCVLSSKAFC